VIQLPTTETTLFDAAKMYLDLRLRPIPVYGVHDDGSCTCGSSDCKAPGKHPIGSKWQARAPRKLEEAREAFEGHHGNIGVCVADTPFVILDFDGEVGLATLNDLEADGIVPETLRARSGSGGAHLVFELESRHDAATISDRRVGPGWDVKKHGQVLAAPSRHACGGYYEWIDTAAIALLTDALYERIRKPVAIVPRAVSSAPSSGSNMVERARAYVAKMDAAISGQGGHDATFAVARKLIQDFKLGDSDAWSLLLEYNDRCEPPWSERELKHKFDSALKARVSNPMPERPLLRSVGNTAVAAVPSVVPIAQSDWKSKLLWSESRTGKQKLVTHAENVVIILREHPQWKGKLRFDEFRGRVECIDPPWSTYHRPTEMDTIWSDEDATRLHAWLRREFHQYAFAPSVMDCERSVDVVARSNALHPVRKYLTGIAWDQQSRLIRMGVDYLGADNTDYVGTVFKRWMISAVARVIRPGCKADHVLILEGNQGIGKSSALGILGGDWFSDTPIDLNSKDAYGQIKGKWIVELAELDSLFRVEASRAKAFFSSPVDNYRPAYGRREREQPRQCVFAGSVNEGSYLRDPTGARRFWPVLCRRVDREAMRRDRDQLWAEAFALFNASERWWPEGEEVASALEAQEDRTEVDDWEEKVRPFLLDKAEVTSAEVLGTALKIDAKDWTRAAQMRVGHILIHRFGWAKRRAREGTMRSWAYHRPSGSNLESKG